MEYSSKIPRINQKQVDGKGHIQPGVNQWIGVFTVGPDLLEGQFKDWKSTLVTYEGPFYCRGECTNGRGEAQIIHVRCGTKSDEVIISLEGTDEPRLENKEILPQPVSEWK